MNSEIYNKIISKKEFSKLPKIDVEKCWKNFEKRQTSDEEKIKLCRDLLRKSFFAFGSLKLLNPKIIEKRNSDWILKKHISTRERFCFYPELYKKIFSDFKKEKNISVIDLGCGINGFSYNFFKKNVDYVGVESVGQLVDLTNNYFEKEKILGMVFHESLFEIEKIKNLIRKTNFPRIIFLFKVLDSLEMIEKNFSKKLLKEIIPLADFVVISFATKSLISRKGFNVKRYWFENFLKEMKCKIENDFEEFGERYILLKFLLKCNK